MTITLVLLGVLWYTAVGIYLFRFCQPRNIIEQVDRLMAWVFSPVVFVILLLLGTLMIPTAGKSNPVRLSSRFVKYYKENPQTHFQKD